MALKWPHAEKNLAEFSPRKFSPKTSESTKNGLKREINKKNRKKKFSPQGTHDEKKLRKILALPSKLFPLSSASKGMAMDFFGGLTPLDCRAPVNPAYRKIAPPPPTHLILAKTSTTPKLGCQWWTYWKLVCGPIGNWSVDLSETGLWTYWKPVCRPIRNWIVDLLEARSWTYWKPVHGPIRNQFMDLRGNWFVDLCRNWFVDLLEIGL